MRLDNRVLGNSKLKNSWQDLTISILLVLKSFIKYRLMSSDAIWDLLSSQTSRPQSKMGIHYVCTLPVPLSVPLVCDSIPVQNGIVRRAGKSIVQMLLWGHQMIAVCLQLQLSVVLCNSTVKQRETILYTTLTSLGNLAGPAPKLTMCLDRVVMFGRLVNYSNRLTQTDCLSSDWTNSDYNLLTARRRRIHCSDGDRPTEACHRVTSYFKHLTSHCSTLD